MNEIHDQSELTKEQIIKLEKILNEAQSKDEIEDAKLLFKECEIIDSSECDAYDIDPKDSVEVHKCKATGWHYLYDPKAEALPYYCCITTNTGEFDRLEDLQNWARPLYFQ